MKHETPSFRMIVQDGHLVPAAAWDQERLSTYRNRSTVNVHITQQKNRKLERKYWSILGRVVAQCPVHQRTAEDLHKAIRLKLGIVDAYWTIDGRLRVEVKSTSTMEDQEYTAFYEEAMALLEDITGVNPETLSAESADVGEDEDPETPVAPHAAGEGSDGDPQATPPATHVVAAEPSLSPESGEEAGTPEAREEPDAAPASNSLSADDRTWLIQTAKMLWAATGVGEQDVLKNQMAGIRENLTPATISKAVRDKANAVNAKCKLVCFGEASAADTLALIAGIAGCEPKDLTT